jgi:glycosyltransferase involved in cell wall biosynthesis
MRILLVSEDIPAPAIGGLARHVLTLRSALQANGHQVDLMGNDDFSPDTVGELRTSGDQFYGELSGQFDGWKEMQLGLFMPPKRGWIARRFARAILRRARDYDVIHYHGHLPNIARFIPATVNFIQTRHDQGSDCLIHTRFRRGAICSDISPVACAGCRSWKPNWLQRTLSAAAVMHFRDQVAAGYTRHKTVFVSDLLRRNLERSFGHGKWGVTVHNFVDYTALQAAQHKAGVSAADNTLRVLIAAKLYPAKGVGQFLDTIASCLPQNIKIDVVGDGEEEAALRARHAQFSDKQIIFHGWQQASETLRMTAQANAVVVPSVWEEPCATTVLEALMMGKTIFALRRGGTPELGAYASAPDQLRLFNTMPALVDALLNFSVQADYPVTPRARIADASHAVKKLLALYRLPPGPIPV